MGQKRPQPGSDEQAQADRKVILLHLSTELGRERIAVTGPGREVDAEAISWFIRFHCDPLDQFDWTAFEAWIHDQPAHRRSYERVEQLWYGGKADGEPEDRPEVSAEVLADLTRSGRVVHLRVAPHAPDQRPVRARPVLDPGAEAEALVEGDIARCGGFEPGGPPEPIQSVRPSL